MTKVKALTLVAVILGGAVTVLFLAIRGLNKVLDRMDDNDEWADLADNPEVVKDLPDDIPQGVEGFVPAPRPRDWTNTQGNDSPA